MRTPRDPILRGIVLDCVFVAGALVALVGPLLVLALSSMGREWFFPAVLPPALSGEAWRTLLRGDEAFARALGNSLILALACAAIATALGMPAARALAAWRGRGAGMTEAALVVLPVLT